MCRVDCGIHKEGFHCDFAVAHISFHRPQGIHSREGIGDKFQLQKNLQMLLYVMRYIIVLLCSDRQTDRQTDRERKESAAQLAEVSVITNTRTVDTVTTTATHQRTFFTDVDVINCPVRCLGWWWWWWRCCWCRFGFLSPAKPRLTTYAAPWKNNANIRWLSGCNKFNIQNTKTNHALDIVEFIAAAF